jgi:hypothetical protein
MSLLFLLFSIGPFSAAWADERIPTGPCEQDNQCVLFQDECGVLKSVLQTKLPAGSTSNVVNNTQIHSWGTENIKSCHIAYFVAPSRPENPVPKCVNSKCVIASPNKL